MPYKKLQVKLLSKSGELLNCVNCFAGQVTVLRAVSPADLLSYQRAVSGVPGPERFAVLLDLQPFEPQNHNLIGFGEHFLGSTQSVVEFLVASGVTESAIDTLLVSYGLEVFRDKKCATLPPAEERMLRLLGATYSIDKILILNDPFEPLSSQWRERFAELIVSYARHKQQIVLVTSLSSRPQSWIDNEFIARVQVGDNIQKTIGFGSSSEMNTILNQVRESVKESQSTGRTIDPLARSASMDDLQRPPIQTIPTETSGAKNAAAAGIGFATGGAWPAIEESRRGSDILRNWRPRIPVMLRSAACVAGVVVIAFVGKAVLFSKETQSVSAKKDVENVVPSVVGKKHPKKVAALVPLAKDTVQKDHLQENLPPHDQSSTAPVIPENFSLPPTPVQITRYVLDEYPPEVKGTVMRAFLENGASLTDGRTHPAPEKNQRTSSNTHTETKSSVTQTSTNAARLLSSLEGASDTGSNENAMAQGAPFGQVDDGGDIFGGSEEVFPSDTGDREERRELIRQKFLEAIDKAAERRN